jgi:hypothetical protein
MIGKIEPMHNLLKKDSKKDLKKERCIINAITNADIRVR